MYDVGFGDCFLVLVPGRDGNDQKILIDCGSFKAGKNKLADVVGRLILDVTDADGVPRVNLLVATHRHKDHIVGFADPRWRRVEVGEVWMPWTESDEPDAKRVAAAQIAMATALSGFLQATNRGEPFDVLGLNAANNETALKTLRSGFANKPERRYLPKQGASTRVVECETLSDVTIQVLGPSRDLKTILDLESHKESYFSLLRLATIRDPQALEPSQMPEPFGAGWVDDETVREPLDERTLERLDAIHEGQAAGVATRLDHALNNTSLVLVISVEDTHLLFPGDAQWGTWSEILADEDACRLISRCCFYKVGHHGSHNATPVSFVEKLLKKNVDKLWAMVPVTEYSNWPKIPRGPLLDALKKKADHFVRSDGDRATPGYRWEGDLYVEAAIPIR
ncbi:hypothetical protein [uncultured Enterovirga sp.]|uniref:hypothetical protein n=1 Tax=uncultured Enterovirga sp. TaxID=2026352 RepID=UPI0035CC42E0